MRRIALTLLCVTACQQQPVTRNEAIQLANQYVVNEGGNLTGMVPYAEERPANWIVNYELVPPQPGGTPTLSVNKQTREVRVISRTQ